MQAPITAVNVTINQAKQLTVWKPIDTALERGRKYSGMALQKEGSLVKHFKKKDHWWSISKEGSLVKLFKKKDHWWSISKIRITGEAFQKKDHWWNISKGRITGEAFQKEGILAAQTKVNTPTVLFRLVSTELLEGNFYTCADIKHKKDGEAFQKEGILAAQTKVNTPTGTHCIAIQKEGTLAAQSL